MKIIIQPTEDQSDKDVAALYPTVEVSIPADTLSIEQMVELFQSALLAGGFLPSTVDRVIVEDLDGD